MKILLGHFNDKVGIDNIFKTTTGNKILYQNNNANDVRVVYFATPKNLFAKGTMFLHRNIHKYTPMSDGKTHKICHILINRRWNSSLIDVRSFKGAASNTDQCLVVANLFGESLALSKQAAQKIESERFNLRNQNELVVRKRISLRYQINL